MSSLASDLSQKQYAAIGKVACEWAHVEGTLRHYVRVITQWDFGLCAKVTGPLGCIQLFELVASLLYADEAGEQQSAAYQSWTGARKRFDELRLERNRIVHRDWLRIRPGQVGAIELVAKGRRPETVERQLPEMESLSQQISGFHMALWTQLSDFQRARGPA